MAQLALIKEDPIPVQITVAPFTERETFARVNFVLSSLTVILSIPGTLPPLIDPNKPPSTVMVQPMRVVILFSTGTHRK